MEIIIGIILTIAGFFGFKQLRKKKVLVIDEKIKQTKVNILKTDEQIEQQEKEIKEIENETANFSLDDYIGMSNKQIDNMPKKPSSDD